MHSKRPRRGGTISGEPGVEELADQLKPHKPPGAEPVQDEEMQVDPLVAHINAGDDPEKDPPAGA